VLYILLIGLDVCKCFASLLAQIISWITRTFKSFKYL